MRRRVTDLQRSVRPPIRLLCPDGVVDAGEEEEATEYDGRVVDTLWVGCVGGGKGEQDDGEGDPGSGDDIGQEPHGRT